MNTMCLGGNMYLNTHFLPWPLSRSYKVSEKAGKSDTEKHVFFRIIGADFTLLYFTTLYKSKKYSDCPL